MGGDMKRTVFLALVIVLAIFSVCMVSGCMAHKPASRKTKNHLKDAIKYAEKGKYQDALYESNEALSLSPDLPLAHAIRGMVYWYMGNYDAALYDTDNAIEFDRNFPFAYYLRAIIWKARYEEDLERACNLGYDDACDELKFIRKKKHTIEPSINPPKP